MKGDSVRQMRSHTKETTQTRGQMPRRTQRVRSEQSRSKAGEEIKREEIKTFTFKFVKEVKESSIPKKKGTKKTVTTSTKKFIKRS